MGEPTCVMHAFSYPSGISNDANEDNPMYALGESVSLGRFMSESLSWEKWSSFSRNRYVEEAEMYSRPGSVKQKKAYFEAHFKRMAALKAAALLEQANGAQGGAPDKPRAEDEVHNDGRNINDHADLHGQQLVASTPSINDQQGVEKEAENSGFADNHNEHSPHDEGDQLSCKIIQETDQAEQVESIEHFMDVETQNPSTEMESRLAKPEEADNSGFVDEHKPSDGEGQLSTKIIEETEAAQVESAVHLMDVEKQNPSTDMESGLAKTEEADDLSFVTEEADDLSFVINHCEHNPNNEEDQLSTKFIEERDQAAQVESTECLMDAEEQNPNTETESGLAKVEEADNSAFVANYYEHNPNAGEDQLSTKIIEESDQAAQVESAEHLIDAEKQNPGTEMESGLAKTKASCLEHSSIGQDVFSASSPRSKRNPPLSTYIPASPKSTRKSVLSSYKPSIEAATSLISSSSPMKSVVKPPAIHPGKENTCTPVGRKSWVDDPDKKRTPLRMSINRELNRLISPVIKKIGSSSKSSNKDCSTPLQTPAKASANGMTSAPSETSPQSGKRRARALFDSSGCGSKAAGPRWQFLSAEGAKLPAAGRNKTSSPIIPKSFCLSSRDRVPRRKEKLEEKFNAKATENVQQQSKLKEKPKELAKLRHSFCFGAKLSSASFREQERLEVPTEKLPKKGSSRLQNMTSLPPRRPALRTTENVKQNQG